ncbi:lamin tail domain-containing protein [Candidatus Woesearchaeota archaeon]|nr:MAG: lamin tail domain-containing protein [Candidatus Woesearchaeota archaeon]
MKNPILLLAIIIIFSEAVFANLIINEIMYNPSTDIGDDSDLEWIELYNNGTNLSLELWHLEAGTKTTHFNLTLENNTYLVIARELVDGDDSDNMSFSDYYNITNSTNITAIQGNISLNNQNGEILLYYNGTLNLSVQYDSSIGADGNGFSLEFWNNSWNESIVYGGTPGKENSIINLTGANESSNETNSSEENETNECNASIKILTEQSVYESGEKVEIMYEVNNEPEEFVVEYWVEDLFGNIVKDKRETTNANKKSWTPSIAEQEKSFLIKTNLTEASCNDTEKSDNYDEKLIAVKGEQQKLDDKSSIEIEELSKNSAKFGDIIKAKLLIYKGDTNKKSIKAYVENDDERISEITSFSLHNKFTEYELEIPLIIKPNCDQKLERGDYELVVEGLGEIEYEEINVNGFKFNCLKKDEEETLFEQPQRSGVDYIMQNNISNIIINKSFYAQLKIVNNDAKHNFTVWSYVYKGSKVYSDGNQTDNSVGFGLDKGSSMIVRLYNKVSDAPPGDYKYKIKIKNDGQKTNHEITIPVVILPVKKLEKTDKKNQSTFSASSKTSLYELKEEIEKEEDLKEVTGTAVLNNKPIIVYESSSFKSKKLIYYLLLTITGIICVALIWRRLK